MTEAKTPQSFDQLLSVVSTRLINSGPDETRSCFDEVLVAMGHHLDVIRCYIFEFHETNRTMSNTHEWVGSGVTSHIHELQNLARDDLPYFFRMMTQTHRFLVNDVSLLPEEAKAERSEFEREGISSVLCLGLVVNNELLGFLGCDKTGGIHEWTDEEIQRLGLVADMVANAMQRERTYRELISVRDQLEDANIQLALQASQDGLTGIPNRRALDERLRNEMQRAKRTGSALAVLMIDIDFFKSYNDHNGHLEGDKIIREVASAINSVLQRRTDFVARYGGEEFAAVLAVENREEAIKTAEVLVSAIKDLEIPHVASDAARYVTISVGGYCSKPTANDAVEASIRHFLEQADRAVYRAKHSGRNCACFE